MIRAHSRTLSLLAVYAATLALCVVPYVVGLS
jgi:hypothetical protein